MNSRPDDLPSTARVVRREVEVPATPEQVWRAIATGPGIATWFVPAEVEEREGGRIVTHHGAWGDSVGTVTVWDPPRRFAYEERDYTDKEGAPPWATEVLVEARGGGTCVVRLTSGFFDDGQGWEKMLEGTDEGWTQGLNHLRLYLTHFPDQPVAALLAVGEVQGSRPEAFAKIRAALGLDGAAVGTRVSSRDDAPPLAGVVEATQENFVLVRSEVPGPGLVDVGAWAGDNTVVLVVRGYLYGDDADELARSTQPRWVDWLGQRFGAAAVDTLSAL